MTEPWPRVIAPASRGAILVTPKPPPGYTKERLGESSHAARSTVTNSATTFTDCTSRPDRMSGE